MGTADLIYYIAELVGTAAFALSGAMVAIDRGLDLFGIVLLGGVTALGGGTIRDVLLGITPPTMFYSYEFLTIAAFCSILIFFIAAISKNSYQRNKRRLVQIFNIFDAIGLGVFTVTGVKTAIMAGYGENAFLCVFLGMTTGVGGGILRDMLSRETPFVLRKYIYATAAIAGATIYYLCEYFNVIDVISAYSCIVIIIVIRMLATVFNWSLPRIKL